jgi:hypothetical protein
MGEGSFHTLLDVITPILLVIFTVAVGTLRRTNDKINQRLESHDNDIANVKENVATLLEWRRGHDTRHTELTTMIHDLKTFVHSRFDTYDANITHFYETYDLTQKQTPRRRAQPR